MQSSLPAGWLAFTGRELNPLDRCYWMARAGLMEKIMRQTTMDPEVREPKDELSDAELKKISGGGKAMHGDLQVQKYLDKASIILF